MTGACLSCGTSAKRLERDHCHRHGTTRGAICHHCNVLMSVIDRGLTPRLGPPVTLKGLLAHAARCPECPPLNAADLQPANSKPITFRLEPDLYDWLRRAAFERRVSQNAIVVRALERELADKVLDGGGGSVAP